MEIEYTVHAIQKIYERYIEKAEVSTALRNGEVIREYPEARPYAAKLVMGWAGPRPIHVVCARVPDENRIIIITAYEPTEEFWLPGFKERRRQ